ncbi:MAG: SMP-30/gluconolactonase/LRE family protein [Acidocella sp.]|nr:SMP-30/gluconolactonase/LRE family protein [Acidocella sp.]
MVLPNARLEHLAGGLRWAEGPVWFADHQCLLVSDIPNNRILRWTEDATTIFRAPSGYINGQTRDRQGRLIGCSHQARSVLRTEIDGSITTLTAQYDGRRLNSPNDVVVKSDGSIWFTDPTYGISTDYEGGKQTSERPAAVYRLSEAGQLSMVADDFTGPNGLCFSPDETRLYITETGPPFVAAPSCHIRVFDLSPDGESLCHSRVFAAVTSGAADGIGCDESGNLWASAADGVHCFAPTGELLGKSWFPQWSRTLPLVAAITAACSSARAQTCTPSTPMFAACPAREHHRAAAASAQCG